MKNGRIILKAVLTNESALTVGSGKDDHSDRDLLNAIYPIDAQGKILYPEQIEQAVKFEVLPFIPATSFMGRIGQMLKKQNNEFERYWGKTDKKESYSSSIDCSDLLLTKYPGFAVQNKGLLTEIRDGIRLDNAKGTVAKGAKYDFEVLAAGAEFSLTMIFRVEAGKNSDDSEEKEPNDSFSTALSLAKGIKEIIENGFTIGAKSNSGFGKMKGTAELHSLDFQIAEELDKWISNDLENSINDKEFRKVEAFEPKKKNLFEINATFRIKNSLIVRAYSSDPALPDSTHLKSGGKNILPGTSIKGALRGRAERILNTIQNDPGKTNIFLAGLFGDVEKIDDGVTVKKDGYTIPSRVKVDEILIENVKDNEIQTRIQIDRFTGGTVDGALIEEVPLFPVKDQDHIKNFRIRVQDAQSADKGLILLLLKDLWTEDLPIGGEKSIGRGILTGIRAEIHDNTDTYNLPDDFANDDKISKLQKYVSDFNDSANYNFHIERVKKYKEIKS